jgi:hypothetical protein
MSKKTPGPWAWRKMGEWVLVGEHGMRPIVLSTRLHGPMKERGFTSLDTERCLLVPFDPNHPNSLLLAAAPDLYDALREAQIKLCEARCLKHEVCSTSHIAECQAARDALAKAAPPGAEKA